MNIQVFKRCAPKLRRPRLFSVAVLFTFLFLFFPASEARVEVGQDSGLKVGNILPTFSIKTFSGRDVNVRSLRGTPTVINFWASWCGPCRYEADILERVYYKFKGSKVDFLGVAVSDNEKDARAFIDLFKVSYPNGLDSTGKIGDSYDVFAIPKTMVLDKDGRITYVVLGAVTEANLSRELSKLVN